MNQSKNTPLPDLQAPSKKYSINWVDAGKGLLVAVGTSVLYFIQTTLDTGSLHFHWKGIAMAAISGGVAYLIKNYFTAPPAKSVNADANTGPDKQP